MKLKKFPYLCSLQAFTQVKWNLFSLNAVLQVNPCEYSDMTKQLCYDCVRMPKHTMGNTGVSASSFKRSPHLTQVRHPWLGQGNISRFISSCKMSLYLYPASWLITWEFIWISPFAVLEIDSQVFTSFYHNPKCPEAWEISLTSVLNQHCKNSASQRVRPL